MRTGDDEAISPKYAHMERERRWRVAKAAALNIPDAHVLIEDRYIDDTRLRLRAMTDSITGKVSLKLTKKYASGDVLARPIVTAYLTRTEYDVFATLAAAAIVKRRHVVREGSVDFSVDIFLGPLKGLIIAEIEWPDDAGLRALAPPRWAMCEVSDDPRYQGGTLAQHGLPGD